ncbi:MAG: 1-pyrroline-5-carboxylate dehydrogenase [Sulfurimonas sp.]|nr:MAG: 1-pyrroline-5-carboxylate dehydrogenase [Sulfurimonas sp.]
MDITHETFKEVKLLAKVWQKKIQISRENKEEEFHSMMLKMLDNPMNKVFLIELIDQIFRSSNGDRVSNQLEYIFSKYSGINFFSEFEKILIWLLRDVGIYLSSVSIPLFINYLRNDISSIIIKGEDNILNKHIQNRKKEGTRVNINIIGEIVLSKEEARERVSKYIKVLENPNVDYLSIKISNLFSQIIPHAYEYNKYNISKALESIYDSAMINTYEDENLNKLNKFINLDMEEYKDLELTVDIFKDSLSKEKYKNLYAGIVIQAYLPDALSYVKDLCIWAKKRVQEGGSPIKIRLVKGANQEMEMTDASLNNWPNVTYLKKSDTDANYKVLMDFLLSKDISPYVNVGIASHNLFDHALAHLLAKKREVLGYCTVEMLEGMSEAAYHVLRDYGLKVILYAPTATKDSFTNAISYLVRRFDENTAEKNFLRHSFGLKVDSPAWFTLLSSYEDSISSIKRLNLFPNRTQNRNIKILEKENDLDNYKFKNESDTDFVLKNNRKWLQNIRDKWKNIYKNGAFNAYPVVAGELLESGDLVDVIDKSQINENILVGRYIKATKENLSLAIKTAKDDPDGWRDLSIEQRQDILMNVANKFKQKRHDLIGIAAAEASKVFTETDVEISEAIDFLNFYPYSVKRLSKLSSIKIKAMGVGLVISPWNFPIAIPVGGIAASLASGNTVILKPSSNTVLCAYMLCLCFWEAGVSKNTLQFVPTSGDLASEVLIPSKDINFCIFTGSEDTAYKIKKVNPKIKLSAETGGKNATIVTALADRQQAIKNILVSAFNNSGQKCSATSLLVLESEVYEDKEFKNTLINAVNSLEVGSVWDFENKISALIAKPKGNLQKALTYLEDNEAWAVKPSYAEENKYMLKPSLRWGTRRGDFCHTNELFGPVLSVICAEDLKDAVEIVNSTGYGLTSGLESLDIREQDYFKENLIAGNLYINRSTTGAIVLRQPFGGMRKSSIGSGKKAGGLSYVTQFMNISSIQTDTFEISSNEYLNKLQIDLENKIEFQEDIKQAFAYASNFSYWKKKKFLKEFDYAKIRGQSNIIRYIPVKDVLLRIDDNDIFAEVLASIMTIKMIGIKLHISISENSSRPEFLFLEANKDLFMQNTDEISIDSENELSLLLTKAQRIRYLQEKSISTKVYETVANHALHISSEVFVSNGRIELTHYYLEQSISDSFHRYGNLGLQAIK